MSAEVFRRFEGRGGVLKSVAMLRQTAQPDATGRAA